MRRVVRLYSFLDTIGKNMTANTGEGERVGLLPRCHVVRSERKIAERNTLRAKCFLRDFPFSFLVFALGTSGGSSVSVRRETLSRATISNVRSIRFLIPSVFCETATGDPNERWVRSPTPLLR